MSHIIHPLASSSVASQPIKPKYIAIEGCIGVGKTTLSKSLAERMQGNCVLEQVEENPFLTEFYEDRAAHAFKTQIFFLLSRYKQQQALKQQDLFSQAIISDYIMQKDKIFAELTISGSELALYEQLYQTLCQQVIMPDLIIYLRAPLETICGRIAKRGRSFEKNMDKKYLATLIASYDSFFSTFNACPLLILDTEELNFPERPEDISYVIDVLSETINQGKSLQMFSKGEFRQPQLFPGA